MQEDGDCQIATTSLSIGTTKTSDEVSLNADASKKVSSNVEEQLPSISSPIESQFPSIPFKVSRTPDIKRIQDAIASSLGLQLKYCNESNRPKKLRDRLTNGDKILLVMDDIWDEVLLDFQAIGIPNLANHKGCRILLTSRFKQIFNKMNCDSRIELDLLSEEDAWIMFQKYTFISNSSSKEVIGIGHKIVKECKQLPATIAVYGGSLRGQDQQVHEWDMKLQSLKKRVSYHRVDDDMIELYQWLKPNYHFMKDKEVMGLFLLCSVFGEDEQISVEVLTIICTRVRLFEEDYRGRDKVVEP
ncbi:unnamed protein product [Vicia faba]|uniref:NB-ARC domain-containing protein n=1 Tax=Vicia faba TaxID=3906 RepID=A0AAV0ZJG7_VICFA|nr:unnamed protein product [Vicia faba]